MKMNVNKIVSKQKLPPMITGLSGIMELFNVSKSTAWKYKQTWLAPAITQRGRIIFVDTKKALELLGMENPELFVKVLTEKKNEL